MKHTNRLIFILLFFCISIMYIHADQEWGTTAFSSARTAALGGTHAALSDDLSVLFNNPAGFRSAGPEFLIVELSIGLSGPIFDMTSIVLEGMSGDLTELLMSDNVQNLLQSLYAAMKLTGPISFGYVGNGLGFGFYNDSILNFTTQGTVPVITTRIGEQFVFAGGYSFRIPLPVKWKSSFDIGALLKASISGESIIEMDLLSLMSAFDDPLGLVTEAPMELSLGIGVDLGLIYTFKERFSVGLVGRNLYSPSLLYTYSSLQSFLEAGESEKGTTLAPIDLSMGLLYKPPLGRLKRYISELKLMLDYEDILDFLTHPATSTNPILHAGLGIELVLFEILSIRGGFYQGLFSAGFGFDLSIFTLNMAMFGTEISPEPGLRPVFNLLMGMEFKL